MKLHENDSICLSLDEKVPCLEWIGKKFLSSEEFRQSEEKSLEYYLQYKKQYPGLGWFVNASQVGAVSPRDTQWVAQEILPKFAAAGLKKEAFVIESNASGEMTIQTYESQAGQIIEIKMFNNGDAAKSWLKA
jgi:hypothetical protein